MEWLWPLDDTINACKDTFLNALNLMEEFPEYKFIQSMSLYYLLMELRYPDVYKRIQEKIKTGRWIITGGTFNEFDANMPSGEALCRHFLYGLRYFKRFGSPKTL